MHNRVYCIELKRAVVVGGGGVGAIGNKE